MQLGQRNIRYRRGRRPFAALFVASAVVAITVVPAGANPNDPPSVSSKQNEAARVLAEVNALDAEVGRAVEEYNGANLHLQQTTQALQQNTRLLGIARTNVKKAQAVVAARLVQLYSSDEPTVVDLMIGAKGLDEVLTRLDAQERIADQDARIADDLSKFNRNAQTRQRALIKQKARAARLADEKAAKRWMIEGQLREREQLLSTIRSEVARLKAAEQVRQAELARQLAARLAAQQVAVQAQGNPAIGAALETTPTQTTPTQTTPDAASDPASPPPAAAAPPAPAPPAPPAPPARYGAAVSIAMGYLGIPYRWGGATPSGGFDCSGLTMYVYAQLGVSLPHYTGAQWQMGTPVARDDLQPGDLLFFDGLGHEGMYVGNNQMIHAPKTGDVVKISSLTGWYADTYMGARRL